MQKSNLILPFHYIKEVDKYIPQRVIKDRQGKQLHIFYIKQNHQDSDRRSQSKHSTDDRDVLLNADSNCTFFATTNEETVMKWLCVINFLINKYINE